MPEKKIGEGWEGDVYLIEEKGKKMIKKISHMPDASMTPDFLYSLWRELAFAKFALSYPDYFMQLQSCTVENNCNYKKNTPAWIKNDKKTLNAWRDQQKTNTCAVLKYTPVLDGTLMDIYTGINEVFMQTLDRKTWRAHIYCYKVSFQLLFQQLYILYLIESNGWQHRDAHGRNWLYKQHNTPKMLIFGKYKLKTKIQLYLCDYGRVIHKDHPTGVIELVSYRWDDDLYRDIAMNIQDNIYEPMGYWLYKYKINIDSYTLYKKLVKTKEGKTIKFKHTGRDHVDIPSFITLFKLKYPKKYYERAGLDLSKPKIAKSLIQYSEWEIGVYQTLINLIPQPTKLIDYLASLC